MKHSVHGYPLKDAQGRKSVQEIVREQLASTGDEDKFVSVYHNLHKVLATDKVRMLRNGDTLFLITILEPGNCYLQMLNADTKANMLRNIDEAFKALFAAGYNKVEFDTENVNIARLVQNLGYNVSPTDKPNNYIVLGP